MPAMPTRCRRAMRSWPGCSTSCRTTRPATGRRPSRDRRSHRCGHRWTCSSRWPRSCWSRPSPSRPATTAVSAWPKPSCCGPSARSCTVRCRHCWAPRTARPTGSVTDSASAFGYRAASLVPRPAVTSNVSNLRRFRAALAESPPLWWALLYFFCLLCGYYVLRPVRDAMGASGDPATVFPRWLVELAASAGVDLGEYTLQVLFSAVFVAMVLLQPVYGALVARFPRRVFLPLVYLVFIACLLGFYWLFDTGVSGRGAAFYVWSAVFNLFAVAVCWSCMAGVFDNEHAERLSGYIGAGGTIGALVGPAITRWLVGPLGVANLLLVSAGFLAVCLL